MARKIDAGDALAALGALLLFVSLFLDWYDDASGWEAFEALDLVLAGGAIAVLAAAAEPLGVRSALRPAAVVPLGLLLLAIVVVQIIEPPPSVGDAERQTGIWLALAGVALIALGAAMRVARISISIDVGSREARPASRGGGSRRQRVEAVDRRQAAAASESPAGSPAASPPKDDPQPTQPFSALEDRDR